jgi:hypothetical protein
VIGAITAGLFAAGAPAVTNSYESIATVTLGSAASSVSFTGIPSTYKHLQVRTMFLYSNSGDNLVCSYNSGAFSNVKVHYLFGNGATVTAGNDTSIISVNAGNTSTAFSVGVYDFLDYTDTNKTHTLRYLQGQDVNGSGVMVLGSALATNTAAINALTFSFSGGANFRTYTQFALYGIKG